MVSKWASNEEVIFRANCDHAWFVTEWVDGIQKEVRYSYGDLVCLKWLFQWNQIIPIPGEDPESDDESSDWDTDDEVEVFLVYSNENDNDPSEDWDLEILNGA